MRGGLVSATRTALVIDAVLFAESVTEYVRVNEAGANVVLTAPVRKMREVRLPSYASTAVHPGSTNSSPASACTSFPPISDSTGAVWSVTE